MACGAAAAEASSHPDEFLCIPGFAVVADRRIFAVMAFTNALGFDDETQGWQMTQTRLRVRRAVADNLRRHPNKVKGWRRQFVRWNMPAFVYQDLALTLSPDYPFAFARSMSEMNYGSAARKMKRLPVLLNDFWQAARLAEVWSRVKLDYLRELRRYDLGRMESEMAFLWSYLRMTRQDSFTVVSVPNSLGQRFSAIGARYGGIYYCVEGEGARSYGLNIHEYLHSVVNPMIEEAFAEHQPKLTAFYEADRSQPAARTYQRPVTYVYECLVRALDKRIRGRLWGIPEDAQRLHWAFAYVVANGLSLAGVFHALLADYETCTVPFAGYLATLLSRVPEYGIAE